MPKTKSLITGITGFAGSHLAELLLKEGHEVYGLCRWRSKKDNINHIEGQITLIDADLLDAGSIDTVIKEVEPENIFHLAAQSFVPTSFLSPFATMQVNVGGEINIFESVRKAKIDPVILVAGSSEEYGLVKEDEVPIKETNPLRPLSTYAVSKVAQDLLGYQYYQAYKMKIIRSRGFNHTGPRRGDVFASSTFAKQIAEAEKGLSLPVIHVGNLDTIRDFTDVRDMVRAYYLAVEKGVPGEVYNIATGIGYSMGKMLETLLSFSTIKVEIKQDSRRIRHADVPLLIGDSTKFRKQTGWEPTIPFGQTMEDLLNYWRARYEQLLAK